MAEAPSSGDTADDLLSAHLRGFLPGINQTRQNKMGVCGDAHKRIPEGSQVPVQEMPCTIRVPNASVIPLVSPQKW